MTFITDITDNKRTIYSVSQLNQESRLLLENRFPNIWVEGEVSNLAKPASGHLYFTLKDEQAQIRCAMFRSQAARLQYPIEAGNQILVRAKVSLYQTRGDFQLLIDYCEPAGDGALRRAYDLLKQNLAKEGLFDPEQKQALPTLPQTIGVITSPTGAVIRDILTTLKRRFPAIAVIIYPCEVQGKKAAGQIMHAVQIANQRQECNALILARGGGALEDLWPFNEESVARAIFASNIPIVSAVGHETDFTIADFVADQRAATPTAAAELISPDQNEYQQRYLQHQKQLTKAIQIHLQQLGHVLEKLILKLQHPSTYLRETAQTLDYYAQQLRQSYKHCLQSKSNQANTLAIKIKQYSPQHQITQYKQNLHWLTQNLSKVIQQQLQQVKQQIGHHASALETLSPLATLARGYSIVNDKEGVIIRNSKQLQVDERIQVHLHKGKVICKVMEK